MKPPPWPLGSSLHYSWVLRLDPGNKLSEALCQYQTLAATMGFASNYTVDRHQHKGAERGPPPFSHTLKNESVCCRSELCLYSIYSFCPRPLFRHQWELECWWKTGRSGLLRGCHWEFMFIRWARRPLQGTCMGAGPRRATEQPVIGLLDGRQHSMMHLSAPLVVPPHGGERTI